jgi:hypothetical protein
MIVLNDRRTICIDVISFKELPQFLNDASEIMTGFVSFARGEKMMFPVSFLMNKIKIEFANFIENDRIKFVVRIREMDIFNAYEIRIITMELPGKVESITDIDVPGNIPAFCTINAIPKERKVKERNAC